MINLLYLKVRGVKIISDITIQAMICNNAGSGMMKKSHTPTNSTIATNKITHLDISPEKARFDFKFNFCPKTGQYSFILIKPKLKVGFENTLLFVAMGTYLRPESGHRIQGLGVRKNARVVIDHW